MASLAVLDLGPLFRAGLAALASGMGFDPVLQAAGLEDLTRDGDGGVRPDLTLAGLPDSPAALSALIQGIKLWAPETRVVFIAPAFDAAALGACFAQGASGYLIESISREGLMYSLRLVTAGENVFPSELARAIAERGGDADGAGELAGELRALHATRREIDILRWLATGESNGEIARRLAVSENVVSAHVRRILRKLGVSNRTQAALWAVANGIAPPFAAASNPGGNGSRRAALRACD